MKSGLTRAQHYRQLAEQYRRTATDELNAEKRRELTGLADQYEKLAARLTPPN